MKENNISNLAKAIVKTMQEIKGIEKNMSVSTGKGSYNAVSDYDVKKVIGRAMTKNGLSIVPINIEQNTQRLVRESSYNGKINKREIVFIEVKATYLLLHESGESIEIQGLGHGEDSMDKAAGKATTYALKYALLYTFLVPTGHIDDADTTEPKKDNKDNKDNNTTQTQKKVKKQSPKIKNPVNKPNLTAEQFEKTMLNGTAIQIKKILDIFTLTNKQQDALIERLKILTN